MSGAPTTAVEGGSPPRSGVAANPIFLASALLRLELRLLRRSRLTWLSLAMFVLAACASVATVQIWGGKLAEANSQAVTEVGQQLQSMQSLMQGIQDGLVRPTAVDSYTPAQGEFVPDLRDPYVVGFYRPQLALKPAQPLAALALGAAVGQAAHYTVTSRPLNEVMTHGRNAELTHPGLAAVGVLDLASLTVLIAPLLLCGLLGQGLARERHGALHLTLTAAGVRPGSLLLARVAIAWACTLTALLLATAAALATAWLTSGSNTAPGTAAFAKAVVVGQSLQWLGIATAYLLLWAGLAAVVMVLCRSELSSAVGLVGCWFGVVILLPALAAAVREDTGRSERIFQALVAAQQTDADAASLEQAAVLQQSVQHLLQRADTALTPCALMRSEVLRDYVGRFNYDLPVRSALQQQAEPVSTAWWSPASRVTDAFQALAGNRRQDFQGFAAETAAFHHAYRMDIFRRLVDCQSLDAQDYSSLPRLAPRGATAPSVWVSSVTLALLGLMLTMGAAWTCNQSLRNRA